MKGKMKKQVEATPQKWSDMQYLRVELDKQLKADLSKWCQQKHDWLGYIETAVGAKLRFQVLEDAYHSCFEARLTAISQSVGVPTLVLQGRGPTALAAIQSLFFKHIVMLEGDWESLERNADKREISDWG